MKTFSALLALCAGNSLVTGEFLSQRPVTRSFEIFFDAPEQTAEESIETPVIWDAMALIMTSPLWDILRHWLYLVSSFSV